MWLSFVALDLSAAEDSLFLRGFWLICSPWQRWLESCLSGSAPQSHTETNADIQMLLHPRGVTLSPQLRIFMLPSACSCHWKGLGEVQSWALPVTQDTGQGWAQLVAPGSVLGVQLCLHRVRRNRWTVQEERWQRQVPEGVWGLCALELDTVGAGRAHLLLTAFRSQCEWQFWSSSMCTFPGRVGQNCGRCVVSKTWRGEKQKNWEEKDKD